MDVLDLTDAEAEKVAVAPRVTLKSIEGKIAEETYFVHESILTICILKLRNGFFVTGESAPASPTNFNAELGRKLAREQAVRKVWSFEGYLLRDKLADAEA
jgi:hypothetical protein